MVSLIAVRSFAVFAAMVAAVANPLVGNKASAVFALALDLPRMGNQTRFVVIVIMIMENSDGNVCKKQNKTKCQTQKNFKFLFQSFVPPLKNNISIGIKQ